MRNFYETITSSPTKIVDYQISPILMEEDEQQVKSIAETINIATRTADVALQPSHDIETAFQTRDLQKSVHKSCNDLMVELEDSKLGFSFELRTYNPERFSRPIFDESMMCLKVYIGYKQDDGSII